jgi:hypothetical protein
MVFGRFIGGVTAAVIDDVLFGHEVRRAVPTRTPAITPVRGGGATVGLGHTF